MPRERNLVEAVLKALDLFFSPWGSHRWYDPLPRCQAAVMHSSSCQLGHDGKGKQQICHSAPTGSTVFPEAVCLLLLDRLCARWLLPNCRLMQLLWAQLTQARQSYNICCIKHVSICVDCFQLTMGLLLYNPRRHWQIPVHRWVALALCRINALHVWT